MEQTNQMNNQIEEEKTIQYTGVKKSKIVLARLVDFSILFIIALITTLTVLFVTAITPSFSNILNKAEQIQLDSKLYAKDKNDETFTLSSILDADKDMKLEDKNQKLDESLTYFFTSKDFFKENDGLKIYNDLKKDAIKDSKNLFIKDGENYVVNAEAGLLPSVYYDFYKDVLNNKALDYLQNNNVYHNLSRTVSRIFIIEFITMPTLSVIGLFFLVPVLSFKNHNTLGFKTFKIGVIDGNGFVLSNKKAIGAALFCTFVIDLLSIFTFFIPLIISLGLFMYRDDNKNLPAYIFNYYYVDISRQGICHNYEEYSKKEEKVLENSELFSNTPLDIVEKSDKE